MNQQSPSPRHIDPNDRSSKALLWGFVFALLTFLLVVIVVTSIDLLTGNTNTPPTVDTPSDPPVTEPSNQPDQPSDEPVDDPTQHPSDEPTEPPVTGDTPSEPTTPKKSYLMYEVSGVTQTIPSYDASTQLGVNAPNTVVVDPVGMTVVAAHAADEIIYPASMTKVMTLLVACERLRESDYDKTVTISADVVAEMQRQGASGFGFAGNDVVTVRDLLYAVALESDGVASVCLAEYVAGSRDAFVRLMNEKCTALGLRQTNFTNVTGLHDAGHYTTCREMASIMAAALDHTMVATLLGEDSYVTRITHRGTPGMRVTFYSTYYMDIMSSEFGGVGAFYALPNGARVIAAKTGTTEEAGHCLVSCIRTPVGKQYIVVSAGADNATAYCADLFYIYQTYAK